MALLAGHMTKLQAVNSMLGSIGEEPVNGLDSGVPDAQLAEDILDRVSREIQMIGWHCNTRPGIVLNKDASNFFGLPDNTLKVDTVNPRARRGQGSNTPNKYVNAGMRRSSDDTQWLLYDLDNDSETWTSETTLTVDLVQLIEFANLTPALQHYVWTSAAQRFQRNVMGSAALDGFTDDDVAKAEVRAVNDDFENEDLNVLYDNQHVRYIAVRNHPLAGR